MSFPSQFAGFAFFVVFLGPVPWFLPQVCDLKLDQTAVLSACWDIQALFDTTQGDMSRLHLWKGLQRSRLASRSGLHRAFSPRQHNRLPHEWPSNTQQCTAFRDRGHACVALGAFPSTRTCISAKHSMYTCHGCLPNGVSQDGAPAASGDREQILDQLRGRGESPPCHRASRVMNSRDGVSGRVISCEARRFPPRTV